MPRQDLEQEAIFALFRQWEDEKLSTEVGTRRLVELGYLNFDVWELQKEAFKRKLHLYRRRCTRNGEVKEQWLNLIETDDQGNKVHYWRKFKRANIDELVQHFNRWIDRIEECKGMFYLYFDELSERKRRQVTERLGIDNLPPRPRQMALVGMEED